MERTWFGLDPVSCIIGKIAEQIKRDPRKWGGEIVLLVVGTSSEEIFVSLIDFLVYLAIRR